MKIGYAFSSGEQLSRNIRISLLSVKRFFNPKDIVIFYTPPYTKEDEQELSEYDLRKKPNLSLGGDYQVYMNRSYFDEVKSPVLFFLDTDTELVKDPRELLAGDFDIKCDARRVPGYEIHIGAQFFIMKNSCHKELGGAWRQEYLRIKDENIPCKDETSLYLAVRRLGLKIEGLPPAAIIGDQIPEHNDLEPKENTYIIHYGSSGKK